MLAQMCVLRSVAAGLLGLAVIWAMPASAEEKKPNILVI